IGKRPRNCSRSVLECHVLAAGAHMNAAKPIAQRPYPLQVVLNWTIGEVGEAVTAARAHPPDPQPGGTSGIPRVVGQPRIRSLNRKAPERTYCGRVVEHHGSITG